MSDPVHHFELDCIEALQRPIAGAQVRAVQLSKRGVRGSLRIVDLDDATLSHGAVDGDFFLEGALSPDRVVLGVLLAASAPITHWASEVTVGDLGFFTAGGSQTALYRGRSEYLTLALTEERLADFADRNEFRLNRAQLRTEGIISDGGNLLELGRALSKGLRQGPRRFADPAFAAEAKERFLESYLSRLEPESVAIRKSTVNDRFIVKNLIDVLQSDLAMGYEVGSICTHLGIPRRTLHRAVVDVTGLPPGKFMRHYRLNEVRRRLSARGESVTETATQCGFTEFGKFAAYYRWLFGESPSATRARVTVIMRSVSVVR